MQIKALTKNELQSEAVPNIEKTFQALKNNQFAIGNTTARQRKEKLKNCIMQF